jgi:hypothetical protein
MPKLLIVKAFGIFIPVEATGFEPTTSASRTQRSTKLSHASIFCFLNSRPSTIAIIYDVYRNVNTFFEIFLIFFIIASKGTFYTGLRPFWCSFRMTVSEKVKKRDMPEVLFRHISYLCFSAQLIYICILHAEAQRLGMAAAEDVYVAVSGSAVFYRVNLAVDHQFRSEWYTAHGDRSSCGRCGSARGGSAGPLSGTDGTGAIACQFKSSKVCSAGGAAGSI